MKINNKYLIIVLLAGLSVWLLLSCSTALSYLASNAWNKVELMIGPTPYPATFNIFGFTIPYQYEGYTDYAYYYVHWGHNVLNGVPIYSNAFGHLELDGINNNVGMYIFPPLTAWLYGLGVLIHPRLGIALFIVGFGYLTAIPVYGITKEFTKNETLGAIAAGTYLFNPLTLYYICYLWLNPSIFYFFGMMGLWCLVRGNDIAGTLFIVTAALFKQTAWFLMIPLVIYLIMKDKRTFGIAAGVSAIYTGIVMSPFLYDITNVISTWFRGLGSYPYIWGFEYPHGYGFPITLTDTFIYMGNYSLAEIYYNISSTGILMFLGMGIIAAYMVRTMLKEKVNKVALKELIFLTFILLIWIHVFGPRGCFKYYLSYLAPFMSIFATSNAIKTKGYAPVTTLSYWTPGIIGFLIFFVARQTYLWILLAMMIIYIDHETLGSHYKMVKEKLHELRITIEAKWSMFTKKEKHLTQLLVVLMLLVPLMAVVIYNDGYVTGYYDGYDDGDLSAQREVVIQFGDLVEMPCARNITVIGADGRNYINSMYDFVYNFTFYAGHFYLGALVYINITLYFNITNGYDENNTLTGSYIVGREPIVENWIFIGDGWISYAILAVYEQELVF